MPASANNPAGLLAILLAVLLWGAMPFLVELASRDLAGGQLTVLRLIFPGIILGLVVGPKNLWLAFRHNWILFLLVAGVGFSLPQLTYVYAVQSGASVTLLNFIASGYPVLSLILAVIFLKERPTVVHGLAMGIALLGLYLLAGPDISAGQKAAIGIFWAFLSALGWAVSGVAGKRITANLGALPITALRHLLGAFLLLPLLAFETPKSYNPSLQTWLAIAALVVMSIISYYAYYRGLAKTSVSTASLLESLQSVVTLIVGVLIGRPGMNPTQLTGAALVFAGTVIITITEIALARPTPQSDSATV
jgi:drug/metabolite transporter (DMT)-like permease